MLSFEEFRAIQKRESLQEQNAQQSKDNNFSVRKNKSLARRGVEEEDEDFKKLSQALNKANETGNNGDEVKKQSEDTSSTDNTATWRTMLGKFLDFNISQNIILLLLLMDFSIAFLELQTQHHLLDRRINKLSEPLILHQFVKLLGLFCEVTQIIFLTELFLHIIAFSFSLFSHWGYLIDIIVVGVQLFLERRAGYGHETRLLNIFRGWRLLRVIAHLINIERQKSDALTERLQLREIELQEMSLKCNQLALETKKEHDARQAVERMLVNYKEEVDTLNEALKIAAMDIAEVGQAEDDLDIDEILQEDDAEEDLSDAEEPRDQLSEGQSEERLQAPKRIKEEGSVEDSASRKKSASSRAEEKANALSEVLEAGARNEVASLASLSNLSSSTNATTKRAKTFVVREDGAYMHI